MFPNTKLLVDWDMIMDTADTADKLKETAANKAGELRDVAAFAADKLKETAAKLKDVAANTADKLKETAANVANELVVTAEQLATSQLKLFVENSMFKAIFNTIADGTIVADQQGHVLFFNQAATDLFGMDIVGVTTGNFATHYHLYKPDKTTPWTSGEDPLSRAMQGKITVGELMWVAHVDKPGLVVSCMSVPLTYKNGDNSFIVGGLLMFRELSSLSSQY